jgi:hypothetical protein
MPGKRTGTSRREERRNDPRESHVYAPKNTEGSPGEVLFHIRSTTVEDSDLLMTPDFSIAPVEVNIHASRRRTQ